VLDGPFRGTEALASGLLTRAQLFGPRFRRLFPDVYLPAGVSPDLALRSRAAYLLVRDQGGVLAGYSAAELLGAGCAPATAAAEVLVGRNNRAHPGLLVRRGQAADADVVEAAGIRVTSPARTAWDLARRLPPVEAAVALDALARVGGFAPDELLDRRAAEPGTRGSRGVAEVVGLADPRAESVRESRLRLGLVRAGLPAPRVQHVVRDDRGFLLARVDLAYPDAMLALECDDSAAFDVRQMLRERQRDALLAGYGWVTLRLVPDEVGVGILQTAHRVQGLLARRRGLGGGPGVPSVPGGSGMLVGPGDPAPGPAERGPSVPGAAVGSAG
jgi:hypothetical protein